MEKLPRYSRRLVLGMAAAASFTLPNMAFAKTVKVTDASLKDGKLSLDLTGDNLYEVSVSKKNMGNIILKTPKGDHTLAKHAEMGREAGLKIEPKTMLLTGNPAKFPGVDGDLAGKIAGLNNDILQVSGNGYIAVYCCFLFAYSCITD